MDAHTVSPASVVFFVFCLYRYQALGAVHMSRASPANRADAILSRPMVAQILRRTKIKRHSRLKQHESLPSS